MSMLMLLLAAAVADAPADPMEPATRGMLQCHAPDDVKKTCKSLASYTAKGDGTYTNDAILLIAPDGPLTLRTSSIVRVKDGAICGTLTTKQFDKAQLFYGDTVIPPGRADPILDRIEDAMTSFIGKEICSTYTPGENGLLVASPTVDGAARPELKQNIRWVSPGDGYKVAP